MSFFFTPDDVRQGLRELAYELRLAGLAAKVQVVGGAGVALQVGREVLTRDVDALHPPTSQFTDIVGLIAQRRGWPENWLNDAVKGFASHYDSDEDWELFEGGDEVTVLIARPRLLLAMKLLAGRGTRDQEDIDRLLDACSVTSVAGAELIFAHYYPSEVMNPRARAQLIGRFRGESQEF